MQIQYNVISERYDGIDTVEGKLRHHYDPDETWTHSCLQTRESSSLIAYPINKALCHICSWGKQRAGNIYACKNKIN